VRGRRAHCARAIAVTWLLGAAALVGCGGTSAKVLARVDGAAPLGPSPRVDVFLLRSVSTCAVGKACTAGDASQCFYLADSTGSRVSFSTDGLRFVEPDDPRTQTADRVECFKLVLDDAAAATARDRMASLRSSVFQASGGTVDLDMRIREVPSFDAAFIVFNTGPFLPPSSLETLGLGTVSRDTDFVYALSGYRDPETGLQPKLDYCAGTNWLLQGVLGASPYTWMALTDRCLRAEAMMGTFLSQAFFGMRDVLGLTYPRDYPACGRGDSDPRQWFPDVDDCTRDPDAPACGQASCPDWLAFYQHVVTAHWPRAAAYNGNYCADGRMDNDETGVDTGGVCDLIGR